MLRRSPQAEREVRRDSPLRRARTCYGHLAGVAGTALLDELLRAEWVTPIDATGTRPGFALTPLGERELRARGVESTQPTGSACLDWTERRPHLGGKLGLAVTRALEQRGALRRAPGSRVVALHAPLEGWLDGPPPA